MADDTPNAPSPETPATAKTAKPKKLPFTTESVPIYEVLLGDPLGRAARGERRNLLAGSVMVLLVTIVKLKPEKIDSLGIDIKPEHLERLGFLFFWVMVYFMVMFLGYAVADLLARVHEYVDRKEVGILDENVRRASFEHQERQIDNPGRLAGRMYVQPPTSRDAAQVLAQQFPGIHGVRRVSKWSAAIRAILDFLVPIGIGTWALLALWHFAHPRSTAVKPPQPSAHSSTFADSIRAAAKALDAARPKLSK